MHEHEHTDWNKSRTAGRLQGSKLQSEYIISFGGVVDLPMGQHTCTRKKSEAWRGKSVKCVVAKVARHAYDLRSWSLGERRCNESPTLSYVNNCALKARGPQSAKMRDGLTGRTFQTCETATCYERHVNLLCEINCLASGKSQGLPTSFVWLLTARWSQLKSSLGTCESHEYLKPPTGFPHLRCPEQMNIWVQLRKEKPYEKQAMICEPV